MKLLISFVALSVVVGLGWRIIAYPASMHYFYKKPLKLALLLALILVLIGWFATPVAVAEVSFLKEANQWIYQSQVELLDEYNHAWEVTALKQMEGDRGFYLRLVTVSPSVQLDAVQPLVVTTDTGEQFSVPNVTRQQFMGALPDPNVGQYDIQSLLYKAKKARSLQLQLPTRAGSPIVLSVPSDALEEWSIVGTCEYLVCAR
ncbi:DUF3122 domain-containing protein [Synechococcus sp. PCC 7335]|uniref:DUF3122 domain-containing protein n=1 Tax=Synechococcus sp. (strain ATCC 29403 / PCC 7335) TaxID=91464 RepID=UPI00056FA448|nr:DUF3122 domain-containing protein [Synechococcus sp. PCC 7335]